MAETLPQSRAAGFVLTREGPRGREYLLLVSTRDGHPGLPKGHADGEEDDLATARRETREETGLDGADLDVEPGFRQEITYRVRKDGRLRRKTVVYFRARLRSGEVRLSHEHTSFQWVGLEAALDRIDFPSLRDVIWLAALHGKDPALFRIVPPDLAAADRHLASLPHADARLLAHLRGASRLASSFAEGLAAAGVAVVPAAAAVGALLHDAGRALGRHDDHQVVGSRHLHGQRDLAPYAFACISHFTKGATPAELLEAGLPRATVDAFAAEVELGSLTPEEACVALADSCMKGPDVAPPAQRFADLRRRYDAPALIDLQERRTAALRERLTRESGRDPLAAVGLA